MTHGLRSIHDAILVGAGTVRQDNPRLASLSEGGLCFYHTWYHNIWVGESGKCYFKRYEEEFVLLRGVCAGSNVALPHRPMPIFPNERRLSQSFNVVAQTRCPTPQTLSAGLCFGSCPASRDVAVSRPVLPPLNNVLCIPNRFFSIIFAKLQAQRPTLATGKPVCCPSRGCRRRQQR